MDVNRVIEVVNREFHTEIDAGYYTHIGEWMDWWRGYHKPFHQFRERLGKTIKNRDLFTLRMAKKICEDWAAILLNDKTTLTLGDNASSRFLQGEDGTGGVFGECDFWHRANELCEKAFASGTGAVVLHIDGMTEQGGDEKTRIRLDFLPAMQIIPLSAQNGRITEAAFFSEHIERGKHFLDLEVHLQKEGGYAIENRRYRDDDGVLTSIPLPDGIADRMEMDSEIPFFAILRPNMVNNIDCSTALGISVFANAIDNLKGVDLAYNNFCRDLTLGGKKVFLNRSLIFIDEDGEAFTPDDIAQQLFMQVGNDEFRDADTLIQEFNPSLRTEENRAAIQAQLDYLSFKCGLGTRHYQFQSGTCVFRIF